MVLLGVDELLLLLFKLELGKLKLLLDDRMVLLPLLLSDLESLVFLLLALLQFNHSILARLQISLLLVLVHEVLGFVLLVLRVEFLLQLGVQVLNFTILLALLAQFGVQLVLQVFTGVFKVDVVGLFLVDGLFQLLNLLGLVLNSLVEGLLFLFGAIQEVLLHVPELGGGVLLLLLRILQGLFEVLDLLFKQSLLLVELRISAHFHSLELLSGILSTLGLSGLLLKLPLILFLGGS